MLGKVTATELAPGKCWDPQLGTRWYGVIQIIDVARLLNRLEEPWKLISVLSYASLAWFSQLPATNFPFMFLQLS